MCRTVLSVVQKIHSLGQPSRVAETVHQRERIQTGMLSSRQDSTEGDLPPRSMLIMPLHFAQGCATGEHKNKGPLLGHKHGRAANVCLHNLRPKSNKT